MNYITNAAANMVGNGTVVVLALITTPLLIHALGDARYGLLRIAVVSIANYAGVLDLGLNNAVRRYLSDALHRGGSVAANQVLSTAYRLYSGLAFIVFVAVASSTVWLPRVLRAPVGMTNEFRWLLAASGFYAAGLFLLCPLQAVLIGRLRYDLLQLSQVTVRLVLFTGGALLAYLWIPTLISIAISSVVATTATLLGTAVLAKRVFPPLRISFALNQPSLRREMLKFGRHGLMISLGSITVWYSQDLLISSHLGPAQVTGYALAATMMAQLRAVGEAMSWPVFPIASKLNANGDVHHLRALLTDGILRSLLLWGAISGPLLVFADSVLRVWVGPQYVSARVLVYVLALGSLGTVLSACPTVVLTAVGSISWLGHSQALLAGAALIGMLAVLRFSSQGVFGLAVVASLLIFVRSGIFVPIYAARQLGIRGRTLLGSVIPPLLAYMAASVLIAATLRLWFRPATLFSVATTFGLSCVLATVLGCRLLLSDRDRKSLFSACRAMLPLALVRAQRSDMAQIPADLTKD